MDDKTRKTIVAILTAIVSLIASALGCAFGIQPEHDVTTAQAECVQIDVCEHSILF